MKKSNREHGQRTRAKGFLSRDDKVDLLYSCLQNFGSEGAQVFLCIVNSTIMFTSYFYVYKFLQIKIP